VAERQAESAATVLRAAGWKDLRLSTHYFQSRNPGSGITLAAVFPDQDQPKEQRLGADALGERGKPAEEVGAEAARRLLASLTTPAPVDEYLADQLIPFLGLLPGSRMRVPARTGHLDSNCYVVEQLLPVRYSVSDSLIVESRRR
jgi:RNA 3'-terminal phosphate cyclase (ATP)